MCPFCYIGKRNFENGLKQFDGRDDIEVEWKSFQLDPDIPQDATDTPDVYTYLSQRKGISPQQVKGMHAQVEQMAAKAGLEYHLDKTVMANSFKAHRVIQLAKQKGLGDAAEERLFYANFTEGKDFSNPGVLTALGEEIGLAQTDINEALENNTYAKNVQHDIAEAQQLGINSVPFFVFNRKYAVAGAQPPNMFAQVLDKAYGEWQEEQKQTLVQVANGESCTVDGECD